MRIVQSKIQEIEHKTTKNPRDEAELAQLQTKQQQILSTGKPIEGPTSFTSPQGSTQASQQVRNNLNDNFLSINHDYKYISPFCIINQNWYVLLGY